MFFARIFAKIESSIGRALKAPVVYVGGRSDTGIKKILSMEVMYSLAEVTFCQGEHKGSLCKAIDWVQIFR
jgi:hypothetical protein